MTPISLHTLPHARAAHTASCHHTRTAHAPPHPFHAALLWDLDGNILQHAHPTGCLYRIPHSTPPGALCYSQACALDCRRREGNCRRPQWWGGLPTSAHLLAFHSPQACPSAAPRLLCRFPLSAEHGHSPGMYAPPLHACHLAQNTCYIPHTTASAGSLPSFHTYRIACLSPMGTLPSPHLPTVQTHRT